MAIYYYHDGIRQEDGSYYLTLTVAEWRERDDAVTGDPEGADGEPLEDDAVVTLRCLAGMAVEYCVGDDTANATWMETGAEWDESAWREAVGSVQHAGDCLTTSYSPGLWLDRTECEEAAYAAITARENL